MGILLYFVHVLNEIDFLLSFLINYRTDFKGVLADYSQLHTLVHD